jgi:hypothetical protein
VKNYLKQYLTDREENNETCIGEAGAKTDKTPEAIGFGTFDTHQPYEYPEKFSDENLISTDSIKTDFAVLITYIVGNCPHCRQPLKVFKISESGEVWIQCPTKPELFKALYQDDREWCRDCEIKKSIICGRCSECIQRLLLCTNEACPSCGSLRFWRHRASKDKPAGSLWRCMNCDEPTGNVAIYTIGGGKL